MCARFVKLSPYVQQQLWNWVDNPKQQEKAQKIGLINPHQSPYLQDVKLLKKNITVVKDPAGKDCLEPAEFNFNLVKLALSKRGLIISTDYSQTNNRDDFFFLWKPTPKGLNWAKQDNIYLNHTPQTYNMIDKLKLAQAIYLKYGREDADNWFPATYWNTNSYTTRRSGKSRGRSKYQRGRIDRPKNPSAKFIVKPATSYRGQGIRVLQRFPKFINSKDIVQEYICNPMMVDGLKIDFRLWVLYARVDGRDKLFAAPNFYFRLAERKYSLSDLDPRIHVTNVGDNIKRLPSTSLDSKLGNILLNQMIWIVKKVMVIYLGRMNIFKSGRKIRSFDRVFELMGWDFIADQTGSVKLLEINTNPDIYHPNQKILEQTLDEVIGIVLGDCTVLSNLVEMEI